jgi:hypothetical protein
MPDPAIPRNAYSVLVAGLMNPSIHHPQWYRLIGAIDDDELNASLKGGTSGTTPFASRLQFGSPSLTVTCQPNLWMIQSTEDSSWMRMLTVASLVFAKAKNPTMTMTAFGLMAQRHIDTDHDAKAILAASVAKLDLGFQPGKNVNTNLTLASSEEGFTITTSIQSSVLGERVIFGFYHCDYPAREIESIFDGRFEVFNSGSSNFFADIVSAINARAEKGEDHE